jgi:recombination protein RecA
MARARRESEEVLPEAPARRPEARAFAEIAERSKSFRPAREVLRRVRAVPTIFPLVDWKTRVGGWPIDRVGILHGPSAAGKTFFLHGLGLSFLRRGHMYCFVDAEMTTPIPWIETLFGAHADDPAFVALRPKSYEEAVDGVRRVAEGVAEMRAKGKLPPETTALFGVDSLKKLVPEDLWERIQKKGAQGADGSVDGFGGGAGRLKALLNAAWLDQLVPLMYHTGCAIVLIAREGEDQNASPRDKQFGKDWKVTGGRSLPFDSSISVRVARASGVYEGGGEGEKGTLIGEKHLVEIHKTKVSARQDLVERTYFHTSNGVRSPEGFDRARDLLMLGEELEVVKRSGSWLSFARKRWQGDARFVAGADAAVLDALEAACREKISEEAAKRADVVGGSEP